jgi:hypothetical protein
VLGKSSWAVLALTLLIELFTQSHYRESIREDADLSELFKDVFLFHWKEESQHAILDGWSGDASTPVSRPRRGMLLSLPSPRAFSREAGASLTSRLESLPGANWLS